MTPHRIAIGGHRWPIWLLLLIVLVIAGRLALPFVMRSWLNDKLADLGKYHGHVDSVGVSLWRGAYQLERLKIEQTGSAAKEPLLDAPVMDIQIFWQALMHGEIVAKIRTTGARLSFAAGHGDRQAQTGKGVAWGDVLNGITPFKIDRFEVLDGQVHYYDYYSSPKVDVHLDKVGATMTNLTNAKDEHGDRVADLELNALAMAQSNLHLELKVDPYAPKPDFDLRFKLIGLQVVRMGDLMKAYTPFEPTAGSLDVVVEATGKKGEVQGYVKPIFSDLKLVNWKKELEHEHNPASIVFDAIASTLNLILQNQPKDQLASKIPFQGRLDDPNVDIFTALGKLLQNAFVGALKPDFEKETTK